VSETIEIPADVRACPEDSYAVIAWTRFRRFAAYMAARYNGPVYLVGSCLKSGTPRDIDIRVVVADNEFAGRYGYKEWQDFERHGPNQAWIDDMAKRNGEIAGKWRDHSDFQVYAASHCIQYRDQPRVVLAAPSNLDHIAASTAWFDGPKDDAAEPDGTSAQADGTSRESDGAVAA